MIANTEQEFWNRVDKQGCWLWHGTFGSSGTNSENYADTVAKGRSAPRAGQKNGHSRLSALDVAEIVKSREPNRVVASRFGITWKYASAIRNRRAWKSLGKEQEASNGK